MKKIFTLFFAFTTLVTFLTSCSNDDEVGNSSNSEIIGTWGTEWNNGTGNAIHPKFTFMSNGKVKYYIYPNLTYPELAEIGTWSMNNNIITMIFPETVEFKYKNKVIFINETQFNFEEIQEPGYGTWPAKSYFKTNDPNLN